MMSRRADDLRGRAYSERLGAQVACAMKTIS
ncbi:MAG: hypothetical protein RIT28_3171 [Pseudomonadota bacterium]|jgi:hypothetical protein